MAVPTTGADPPTLAIVPLRAGKSRLATVLDERQRATLRAAMLADVVEALRAAGLERIVVAAGDDESAQLGARLALDVLRDPADTDTLDAALAHAAIGARDGDAVLVVTADLPALTSRDVSALLGAPGDLVIAPTLDGGTGGLLRRPSGMIATCYGPDSAALHHARAAASGLAATVLDLPGFLVDVDTGDDLALLHDVPQLGRATGAWLRLVPQR